MLLMSSLEKEKCKSVHKYEDSLFYRQHERRLQLTTDLVLHVHSVNERLD